MKVWVVMGNDYPDSVFVTEKAAERYVEGKKKEGATDPNKEFYPCIYWRSYEFELRAG